MSEHDQGAYTGEVAAPMLARLGVRVAVVGHSERRRLFCMDDATVGRTVAAVRRAGLVPMLCVGETEEERDAGATDDVLARQLDTGLAEVDGLAAEHLLVAYEPVWAIGTGQSADPRGRPSAACAHLRALADKRLDGGAAGAADPLRGLASTSTTPPSSSRAPTSTASSSGGPASRPASFAAVIEAVADWYRASAHPPRR